MVKSKKVVKVVDDFGTAIKTLKQNEKTVATRRDRIADKARGTNYVGATRRAQAIRKREERKATEQANRAQRREMKKPHVQEQKVEVSVKPVEVVEEKPEFTYEENVAIANEMLNGRNK